MGVVRTNFGVIMQAIEDKILADEVVADADLITWAVTDSIPQLSGPMDILMRAGRAMLTSYDGGAWDFRVTRFLDLTIRSQSVKDTGGTSKSWVKEAFILGDALLKSMLTEGPLYGHFWPSDGTGHLTSEPIRVHVDLPPERRTDQQLWGDYVCTLEVHYMPELSPTGK